MTRRGSTGAGSGGFVRWAAALGAVTVAGVVLAACGGANAASGDGSSGPTNVTLTFGTNSASTSPVWLAADEGIFAKHGLNVHVVQATSNVGATAVVSGNAQFYYGEATTSFQAAAQGTPLEIVANFRVLNDFKFIVRPNIHNAGDLRGKAVAISASGDSTELSTRDALRQFNVPASDVTLLPTGTSSNRLAALVGGRVVGTLLTEPFATNALKQGMHLLLDQTKEPFDGSVITVAKSYAQQNPKTVQAMMESLVDSVKFLTDPANKRACVNVIAKYTQSTPTNSTVLKGYETYSTPGALAMDPYPDTPGGNAILNGLKSEDSARFAGLTLDKVYDTTFAQQLRSSGYLTKTWGSALRTTAPPSPTP